jgi:hypothetical protein
MICVVLAVNWEAVSAIGQVVGAVAVAVVISLIYLGTEVRNNARATRLASMRSLSEAINQYFKTCAEDADLADLWFPGIYDFQPIEGASRMRFSSLMESRSNWFSDQFQKFIADRPAAAGVHLLYGEAPSGDET